MVGFPEEQPSSLLTIYAGRHKQKGSAINFVEKVGYRDENICRY